MIEVAKAISGFPVSPLDQLTLSYGQLQELISQTVAQALEERQEALPETQIGQEKLLEVLELSLIHI